ncbi:Mediator of RNA polymerase II transcription subunit 8 [[Candida] zeylanoides]
MSFDYTSIPLEPLETIRSRLNQVHLSLRKLFDQINHHNRHPTKVRFPNYATLQSQLQILLTQLHTLTTNLDGYAEQLRAANVYPLPTFPATQQENLLTTLLRKKPLPEIDEWIESALAHTQGASSPGTTLQQHDEFAQWCSAKVEELMGEFQFWGFENAAVAGEGKHEAEERDRQREARDRRVANGVATPLHPNQVLRFMFQSIDPA